MGPEINIEMNSVNLWNYPLDDDFSLTHRNKTLYWSHGMDSEQCYAANIRKPENKNLVTYGKNDIEYKFNSQGFRSHEIEKTNIDLLYFGCSFTEGEGLPFDRVWHAQLSNIASSEFGIENKVYSFARSGVSCSSIARKVYGALEVMKLRPKMIIVLFPSLFRYEFCASNFSQKLGNFNYIPGYAPTGLLPELKHTFNAIDDTRLLSNAINEFYRDALFAQTICQKYGVAFKFDTWQRNTPMHELASQNMYGCDTKYIQGEWVNTRGILSDYMPGALRGSYLDTYFPGEADCPQAYPQMIARDYAHPGPNCNIEFARLVFAKIKPTLALMLR